MTFVPKGPINNIPALVQIKACLPTRVCVTRPNELITLIPSRLSDTFYCTNVIIKNDNIKSIYNIDILE